MMEGGSHTRRRKEYCGWVLRDQQKNWSLILLSYVLYKIFGSFGLFYDWNSCFSAVL